MSRPISIRVLRALLVRGLRHEAGEVLSLDPMDAAGCLATGRAELVNEADRSTLRAAVTAANARALRAAGPVRGAPPAGPWRPL